MKSQRHFSEDSSRSAGDAQTDVHVSHVFIDPTTRCTSVTESAISIASQTPSIPLGQPGKLDLQRDSNNSISIFASLGGHARSGDTASPRWPGTLRSPEQEQIERLTEGILSLLEPKHEDITDNDIKSRHRYRQKKVLCISST